MIPKQQLSYDETPVDGGSRPFGLGRWNPSQSPLVIDYQQAVLSEARDQAMAGLRRLARGGVEVAGVFYGTHTDGTLRITAVRPIACEYKNGPIIALSGSDKEKLRQHLAHAPQDPELSGLAVLGCYISHPRGGISLGDRDLELFNEFFPDIHQVALILKPSMTHVRGGFFVREPRGLLQCNQSFQEFDLGMPRATEGVSAIHQIAELASHASSSPRVGDWDTTQPRRIAPPVAEMRGAARGERERMQSSQHLLHTLMGSSTAGSAPGTAVAPARYSSDWSPAVARPRAVILAQMASDRRRRLEWRWLVVWACAMALLIGGIVMYRSYTAPTPLGLRVVEQKDGAMLVQWDPASRSVSWASNGRLGIRGVDGSHTEIDLAKDQLSLGAYLYNKPRSGDLLIRLSVDNRFGFGGGADESTRYVSRVTQQAEEPKLHKNMDKQSLQNEVRRMQEELNRNQQRIKELESLLYNR
jgi:hypothetical protein